MREQKLLEDRSTTFELRMQELEIRYQKELNFMQSEMTKMREDEQSKTALNNINIGEHLNTYTQRKMTHGENMFK